MKQEQGSPLRQTGSCPATRGEGPPSSMAAAVTGSSVDAAMMPELRFCWCCFFCRRRAGAAVISYLVKKRSFARTSYFQQSTQGCCAVAVCGYSCISSLLLMETELQGCFPHGKGRNRGQLACRFTSSSQTQQGKGGGFPAVF